ncbi:MAG TPA: hypothetical protein VN829_18475 [Dongiaceae bacterium]|nr:hypothetical protein [Dongiaceae bacterium]
MQPSPEGQIWSGLRAALLLWIAAHAMSASTLPGPPEDFYTVWTPAAAEAAQALWARPEPALAFDAPAAMEPLSPTLFLIVAGPETPIELVSDADEDYAPPAGQDGPLRGYEPPTWMSVGAVAVVLAGTGTRHHRRRKRTRRRHTATVA